MDRRTFLSHSSQLFVVTGLAPNMFSENRMLESNQRRSLSFSNDWIESVLVGAVHEMPVEDAIVVKLVSKSFRVLVGDKDACCQTWQLCIGVVKRLHYEE